MSCLFQIRYILLTSLLIGLVSFALGISSVAEAQKTTADQLPDIVGGQNADPGEYPWQAMLTDLQSLPFCGGSLLTPRWVVTAGHCVQGINTNNQSRIRVVLGAYEYGNPAESERQVFQLKRVIQHPDFVPATFDNDIALIELDRPAMLTTSVRTISPVQLGNDDPLWVPGNPSIVTGWGFTRESGGTPLVLQEVDLPITEQSACAAIFGSNLTSNMLCAGSAEGGKDACRGDSGGPLIVADASAGFKLAGIVSWGNGCARPNRYGVYTRIANYHDWMMGYIKDDLPTVPRPVNSIFNKGFENGPDKAWHESSPFSLEMVVNYGPVLAASGQYLAWLGGNLEHTDRIWQFVSFPDDTPLFLNFQYQIHSRDEDCEHDSAAIVIGQWRYKTFSLCQQQETNHWQSIAIRLDSFANHSTMVKFVVWNDETNASSFFLDNVQITAGAPFFTSAELIEVAESYEPFEGYADKIQP